MKKILIALDYNPSAEKVAEAGHALAKALAAEVTLLHVITEPSFYAVEYAPFMGYLGDSLSGSGTLIEDIKNEGNKFLTASAKHLEDASIQTVLLDGDTEECILTYSNEWNADLIVIGSHRHNGLERLFAGDLATHILKKSKVPLLIIPTAD